MQTPNPRERDCLAGLLHRRDQYRSGLSRHGQRERDGEGREWRRHALALIAILRKKFVKAFYCPKLQMCVAYFA